MTVRCSECGEALIPRYDHSIGKDVFEEHNHSKEEDQRSEDDQEVEYVEKECPRCDGTGEFKGYDDIHKCKKCFGSGTVLERRDA